MTQTVKHSSALEGSREYPAGHLILIDDEKSKSPP